MCICEKKNLGFCEETGRFACAHTVRNQLVFVWSVELCLHIFKHSKTRARAPQMMDTSPQRHSPAKHTSIFPLTWRPLRVRAKVLTTRSGCIISFAFYPSSPPRTSPLLAGAKNFTLVLYALLSFVCFLFLFLFFSFTFVCCR